MYSAIVSCNPCKANVTYNVMMIFVKILKAVQTCITSSSQDLEDVLSHYSPPLSDLDQSRSTFMSVTVA